MTATQNPALLFDGLGTQITLSNGWHFQALVWVVLDCGRNGVIDREELRALLESTDSGTQYSITVDSPLHTKASYMR